MPSYLLPHTQIVKKKKYVWGCASQLGFDSYNFCRPFHDGSSEKNQNFIMYLCRDIDRINPIFFRKSDIWKNLFGVFLFDDVSPAAFDQSSS